MKTRPSENRRSARRKIGASPARPNIRKILTATDFSGESFAGVHYAIALAEKLNATVALLHVIEPRPPTAGMEAVSLVHSDLELELELAKLVRAQLKRLVEQEGESGLVLTSLLRTGKPFHEITAAVNECAADLIVIATHGYTGVSRVLLGSTAERVVRHASCPVLTVRAPTTTKRLHKMEQFKLTKLLVPIDFSNFSMDALPWAAFLAARFDAEIILIHVIEKYPIDYVMGRELMNQTITPLMKQADAELQRMAASVRKSTGAKASTAVRDGTPYEEICHTARELGVDLIVLTTHGYTGLKHVWLGSTAERVVRHALCPVLVTRELNRKTAGDSIPGRLRTTP